MDKNYIQESAESFASLFQQQLRDLLSEYLYQPLDSSDIDQICNVLTIE